MRELRALASQSVIYGLSGVLSRFIGIFLVPLYTRILTPEDYGVIGLVASTLAVLSVLAVLGLDNSAHRWFWDSEDVDDRKVTIASWAWCQIAISLVLCLGLLLAAEPLGAWLGGRPDTAVALRVAALSLPFSALSTVLTNWLRMQRRAVPTLLFGIGVSLLNVGFGVLLVLTLRWGVVGAFAAQLGGAVVATAAAALLLGDWISPRHLRAARLGEMLRYALPLIPSALAFWIVGLSDRYFLQYFAGTGDVGLYQIASSVAVVAALATTAFQQAWGPFALSIHRRPNARDVYAQALLAYAWVACLVATGLALFAPEAIRLLATEQYVGAAPVVAFLAFGYVMVGLGYVAGLGPSLAKTTRPVGVAIGIAAVVNLAMNAVLVPWLGREGAAITSLVSQAIVPLYLFRRSQQLYPIPYRFGAAAALVAGSLALALVGSRWQPTDLATAVAVKSVLLLTFLPAGFLLRLVTVEQLSGRLARRPRAAAGSTSGRSGFRHRRRPAVEGAAGWRGAGRAGSPR
jgi:O-antigen/teichoic acid export membrane protein